MTVQAIAKVFVSRADATGLKGKKADAAALEFFLGAYAGAHACSNGDETSEAGKLAKHILLVASLIIATRGYKEVQRLALAPPTRLHKAHAGDCAYCDREGANTFHPPHDASDRCESGKHAHCSCDTCF